MKIKSDKMKALLKREQMTIRELAEELGISINETQSYVNGKVLCPLGIASRIINVFGANKMSQVIDWEGINVCRPHR